MERIGGSGDLGVDLTGIDPNGLRVIIQCKRYGRGQKIGSPAVQMLIGAVANQGADRGIFVTTSTYTAPAIRAAKSGRVVIDLIDGDDLTRLAREAGMRPEMVLT
jgi:restriction system protein